MQIPYAHDQGSTTIIVGLQVEKIMKEELFSMASWWKVLQTKNAIHCNKIASKNTRTKITIKRKDWKHKIGVAKVEKDVMWVDKGLCNATNEGVDSGS